MLSGLVEELHNLLITNNSTIQNNFFSKYYLVGFGHLNEVVVTLAIAIRVLVSLSMEEDSSLGRIKTSDPSLYLVVVLVVHSSRVLFCGCSKKLTFGYSSSLFVLLLSGVSAKQFLPAIYRDKLFSFHFFEFLAGQRPIKESMVCLARLADIRCHMSSWVLIDLRIRE